MRVVIPVVDERTNRRVVFQPRSDNERITQKFKERDLDELFYMINKPPRWNEQVGAYVLNFNGRVTMASVKNFQLINPEDQESGTSVWTGCKGKIYDGLSKSFVAISSICLVFEQFR